MKLYSTITMIISLWAVATRSTSTYEGVSWNKEKNKWQAEFYINVRKQTAYFDTEFDAAKKTNNLCEKMEIPPQNLEICKILNPQKHEKTSQYKGVNWHWETQKWRARLRLKGEKEKSGGYFHDETDAGKRVNQLCEEFEIPPKNPELNAIPNHKYQNKLKISQYKGVTWRKQSGKWCVLIRLKGQIRKYGGLFDDELDAGKRVNQLCQELRILPKNPELSAIPNHKYQKKEKSSKYKGVHWNEKRKKWCAQLRIKGRNQTYAGRFDNELDAAKKINQLCQKFGYPTKNAEIEMNLNTLINNDAIQSEFISLIKILDTNNDPAAHTIKEDLIAAMNNKEQSIITGINLRTKNGESTLSIAAKNGFSNAVKFLISKGADKQHFTNEHHTPLSLAVSHNYLNVVQVLFEGWISPNSHETKYLHLSPIFNVKSREIAQLLIDNDAVTHDLYNDQHQSPLTVACQNGYLDVVEFFIDDGLDINHLDNENKTPLFYALENKHHDIAHFLNSKGAQSVYNFKSYTKK